MSNVRYQRYAWAVLGYTMLVIVWGAFVRATGSGAGCGEHWPLCNGLVVPRTPALETIIELSHRLTSGLTLIAVGVLVVWSFRRFPKGHALRQASVLSAIFLVLEAAVGAGLVLAALVKDNASLLRAVVISLHLLNTFLLVGCLTFVTWFATSGRQEKIKIKVADWRRPTILFGLLLFIFVGSSGAVVALGDTLFPVQSLGEGLKQDFDPTSHFLLRLRVIHPIAAMLTSAYWIVACQVVRNLGLSHIVNKLTRLASAAVTAQIILGGLNLVLLAPTWMQLAHLLLADITWVILVILAIEVLSPAGSDKLA